MFCFSFCSSISEIEVRLPKSQLLVLCRNETVLKWMSTCDHLMYQALVEILIPDVLRPIPSEPQSHMTHGLFVCCVNVYDSSIINAVLSDLPFCIICQVP